MAPQSNLYFVWKTFQNGKNPKKVLLLFRIFLNITKNLISLLLFIDYKKINENTIIWQICNKTLTNLKKKADSKFYVVKPKSSMRLLAAHRKKPCAARARKKAKNYHGTPLPYKKYVFVSRNISNNNVLCFAEKNKVFYGVSRFCYSGIFFYFWQRIILI